MNTTLTTLDIPTLSRNFIGIDRIMDRMLAQHTVSDQGYPPYNVIKQDDDTFTIEVAVAGIPKEGLCVNTHEGVLTIEANIEKLAKDVKDIEPEYLHKGIAGRRFSRTFNLAEHVYVKSADVENGILSVQLVREVPEELKPRNIPVTFV